MDLIGGHSGFQSDWWASNATIRNARVIDGKPSAAVQVHGARKSENLRKFSLVKKLSSAGLPLDYVLSFPY